MYALLLPVCAGVLSACSEKKADARTLDGEWTIVEVNGEKLGEEVTPTMSFNMAEKKLHGNAGCNLFNTTVTLDPADVSSITIAPGATTMMACPNMDVETCPNMDVETKVLRSMEQVRAVKAGEAEGEMLLVDETGKTLLVLEKE